MQLVSCLVAGVAGAENGTAEIYQRGTATRATYYTDFEGTTAVSSGADVTLDDNGGSVTYVGELCTIVVKSSGGTTLRTFVEGVSATAVEVISDSFTGTDYSGSPTAVSEPTTLVAILDLFNASGFKDWLATGSVTLNSILSSVSGLFVNVKDSTYGATGDGATDDTNAINAAIDAANSTGGIVFFPPGTYRITAALTVGTKCWLWGVGGGSSIITLDNASANLLTYAGTSAGRQQVRGLTLTHSQSCSGAVIYTTAATDLTIVECSLGSATNSAAELFYDAGSGTITNTLFSDVTFRRAPSSSYFIRSTGTTAINQKYVELLGCRFFLSDGTVPTGVVFVNGSVSASGNRLDASALSSGATTWFYIGTSYGTGFAFQNNFFIDPTGTAVVTCLGGNATLAANTSVVESANVFGSDTSLTVAYGFSSVEMTGVQLQTRELRVQEVADDSAAVILEAEQYGTIVLHRTSAGSQNVDANPGPPGARLTVVLWNDNTGGNIIFSFLTSLVSGSASDTVANNMMATWHYVSVDVGGSIYRWHAVGAGAEGADT